MVRNHANNINIADIVCVKENIIWIKLLTKKSKKNVNKKPESNDAEPPKSYIPQDSNLLKPEEKPSDGGGSDDESESKEPKKHCVIPWLC